MSNPISPIAIVDGHTVFNAYPGKQVKMNNSINDIINGCMRFAQRGTSFAAIGSGTYGLDRWLYNKIGTMVHTLTQDATDAYDYALKLDVTTADTDIAAGDACIIEQTVEGYNFQKYIVNGYGTLSFQVKDTKIGIHCISFRNSGADRSYIAEYIINTANTWEVKTITIPFNFSGGTWDYTNGRGLRIAWTLAAGSNFHTTKDSWQTGNYHATSNQVNCVDNIANDFFLRKVKFEPGKIATPFVPNDFQAELARCHRYYRNIPQNLFVRMVNYAANVMNFPIQLPVSMRITPALISGTETTDWQIFTTAAASQTGFALTITAGSLGAVQILGTKTAHGLTDGYLKFITDTSKNALNAEL